MFKQHVFTQYTGRCIHCNTNEHKDAKDKLFLQTFD